MVLHQPMGVSSVNMHLQLAVEMCAMHLEVQDTCIGITFDDRSQWS